MAKITHKHGMAILQLQFQAATLSVEQLTISSLFILLKLTALLNYQQIH